MDFTRQLAALIGCALFATTMTSNADAAAFSSTSCDFGEAYQFTQAKCTIELENKGDVPITIDSVRATDEGDISEVDRLTVRPHGRAYMPVRISTRDSIGYTKRYFEVRTSEGKGDIRFVEAKGMVVSVLEDSKEAADFGIVELGGKSLPAVDIDLASREVADLKVLEVISKPEYVDVTVGKDKRSLRVAVNGRAPWGLHKKVPIKLRINSTRQPQVWIPVKADFRGEVIPDANPFAFGLVRQGESKEFLLRLRSRSGADFRIGGIKVNGFRGSAVEAPCEPASKGCRLIKLSIDDTITGEVGGHLGISFPDFNKVLDLYVWGMLIGEKTKILDFAEEMEKQAAAKQQQSSTVPNAAPDLTKALRTATALQEQAAPPGKGPLLKWSVANQELIYGYIIYRSDSESGPLHRVNDETILTDGRESSSYQWRDTSAVPGKTYWYTIGYVKRNGIKADLTTAQSVLAQ